MECFKKENMFNKIILFKDIMIELMFFLVLKKFKLNIHLNLKKVYKKENH
jgi:hypothetical protein